MRGVPLYWLGVPWIIWAGCSIFNALLFSHADMIYIYICFQIEGVSSWHWVLFLMLLVSFLKAHSAFSHTVPRSFFYAQGFFSSDADGSFLNAPPSTMLGKEP